MIALVGALCATPSSARCAGEIHREPSGGAPPWGRLVSERTVTDLLERYEELVALRL